MAPKNYDARSLAKNKGGASQILSDAVRTPTANNFVKAVVVDILNDPSLLRDPISSPFLSGGMQVSNPQYLQIAPRNSITARIIDNSRGRQNTSVVICYPFFPPHLSLPVNAGETVWLIRPDAADPNSIHYWMSRVSEPDFVDDINYTHADRKFKKDRPKSTSERAAASESEEAQIPSFPNGAGTRDSYNLAEGENAYDQIVARSVGYAQTVKESIPRYTKRPGETVLQGTNNSLICLGFDRDNPVSDSNNSSAVQRNIQNDKKDSGTIDMVVGRGRTPLTASDSVLNTRNYEENLKSPASDSLANSNPREGDPDFINDLSRFYATMKSNIDEKFGLQDYTDTPIENAAAVIAKSDHVRIAARENGTVRIVKPGTDNAGYFQIESDGTTIVSGPNIIIGDGNASNIAIGDGATEAVIKGDVFLSQLDTFLSAVEQSIAAFQSAAVGPLAPLAPTLAPIQQASSVFRSQFEQFKSDKAKVK